MEEANNPNQETPTDHVETIVVVSFQAFGQSGERHFINISDIEAERRLREICSTVEIHRIKRYRASLESSLELKKPFEVESRIKG